MHKNKISINKITRASYLSFLAISTPHYFSRVTTYSPHLDNASPCLTLLDLGQGQRGSLQTPSHLHSYPQGALGSFSFYNLHLWVFGLCISSHSKLKLTVPHSLSPVWLAKHHWKVWLKWLLFDACSGQFPSSRSMLLWWPSLWPSPPSDPYGDRIGIEQPFQSKSPFLNGSIHDAKLIIIPWGDMPCLIPSDIPQAATETQSHLFLSKRIKGPSCSSPGNSLCL